MVRQSDDSSTLSCLQIHRQGNKDWCMRSFAAVHMAKITGVERTTIFRFLLERKLTGIAAYSSPTKWYYHFIRCTGHDDFNHQAICCNIYCSRGQKTLTKVLYCTVMVRFRYCCNEVLVLMQHSFSTATVRFQFCCSTSTAVPSMVVATWILRYWWLLRYTWILRNCWSTLMSTVEVLPQVLSKFAYGTVLVQWSDRLCTCTV